MEPTGAVRVCREAVQMTYAPWDGQQIQFESKLCEWHYGHECVSLPWS